MRVVRDIFSEHFERAIVDDYKQHHRLVSFFSRTAPELVDRVELFEDGRDPLFEAYGVDPVINGMLERRVDLPSGGYLVIDYAEALTVIDVNTGSFTGKGKSARLEDTITKTNLEAAEEVVRQLRLRDIGGIIVIDFIDMARSRNREAVLKVLRKALDEDRTKTFVVEISPLGLVEMTRQNVTDGVREIMTKPCPVCSGEGVVKSEETIAIEFARHLRHMVLEAGESGPEAYLLRINPRVTAWFIADGARELHALESETGRYFHFEGSEGLPLDYFAVTMEGTRAEISEHSVPFRAGEEVHVDLVEPHMYNEDDAVAKVDGYLIDVVNGVAFVGEKKLVRIEEAGRTIATAVLVGADAEAAEAAARDRAGAREKALQQARRSAAAKKGAAKRREREDGGRREHEDATKTLSDETPVEAGTAPAALEDSEPPRKRPRRRRRSGDPDAEAAVEARDVVAEEPAAEEAPKPRRSRARKRAAADGGEPQAEASSEAPAGGGERQAAETASEAGGGERQAAETASEAGGGERQAAETASEAGGGEPQAAETASEASAGGGESQAAAASEPSTDDDTATPARKGRARKRAAEPSAEQALEARDAVAEEPQAEEAAAPKRRARRRTADEEPEAVPEPEAGEDAEDGDALSSRPRRRGRRGGRRRSRAKAQADAEATD